EISIKSVNGRFLELRFHMPKEYCPFEVDLKKLVTKSIHRGSLDIYIQRRVIQTQGQYKVHIDEGLLSSYKKEIERVARKQKIQTPIHLEFLLKQPNVLSFEPNLKSIAQEKKWLLKGLGKAILSCDIERQREGQELQKDFIGHLKLLQKKVQYLKNQRNTYSQELKEKFELRLKERMKGTSVDSSRVYQEVALLLDKSDIHEELVRLDEHLKNYEKIIENKISEGKKLEFYTQELLREFNTLSSKSPVAEMTQVVVEAKSIVEKLKEQVLNIE
ncbi:MAG TPA: DUF1732 domain-containing protein, partial [Pseudobdellovibrionaceae bacterium]|nr:DUF1732 domain-containing protein [Pseudobdellovibrionaceae bacterium]